MQLTTNVHYDRADKLISLFGYNAWVHYDCGDSTNLNFALSAVECFPFLRQNHSAGNLGGASVQKLEKWVTLLRHFLISG